MEHNCVRELRAVVKEQGECLSKAQHDLADMRLELLDNLLNKLLMLSWFRYALTEQKRELTLVKELVRAMRLANPGVRALQVMLKKLLLFFEVLSLVCRIFFSLWWDSVQDQFEEDDVMRWAATLSRARVTRWCLESFSFTFIETNFFSSQVGRDDFNPWCSASSHDQTITPRIGMSRPHCDRVDGKRTWAQMASWFANLGNKADE